MPFKSSLIGFTKTNASRILINLKDRHLNGSEWFLYKRNLIYLKMKFWFKIIFFFFYKATLSTDNYIVNSDNIAEYDCELNSNLTECQSYDNCKISALSNENSYQFIYKNLSCIIKPFSSYYTNTQCNDTCLSIRSSKLK